MKLTVAIIMMVLGSVYSAQLWNVHTWKECTGNNRLVDTSDGFRKCSTWCKSTYNDIDGDVTGSCASKLFYFQKYCYCAAIIN